MSDELRIEYMPLSHLKRYARNSKDHDIGLLHESIARFGFTDPMAIDEGSGELVEGHGRLDTLLEQERNHDPLPRHMKMVDGQWAAPVVRGLTFDDDFERRAYILASNKITEMGGWHEELLLDELRELAESETPLLGTGYDLDDLDQMLSDQAFRDAPPPEPTPLHAVSLSTRYGVKVNVKGLDEEDELVDMLVAQGFEPKRLSEA
ncbi:MAG: hypothetical protein LC793_04540 [Thermomicrobia bacterium]|nr:hypothetical protein [Thermomicrobia bacterium]MCA1724642.1 hypothetical protein [Thermomicrobia bacterium]